MILMLFFFFFNWELQQIDILSVFLYLLKAQIPPFSYLFYITWFSKWSKILWDIYLNIFFILCLPIFACFPDIMCTEK